MRLETVVPCVGYDDFLAVTLPRNVTLLPSITILTSVSDERTVAIAEDYPVDIILTDAWYQRGPFNKARALNEWLDIVTVDCDDPALWLLFLDADILLPEEQRIEVKQLDAECLYGARRRMCAEYGMYQEHIRGDRRLDSFSLRDVPIENGKAWGRWPTMNTAALSGYFQLWCPRRAKGADRLLESGTAARYDLEFALSFPEENRHFLENFDVLHLGRSRVNWSGRRSERWT
jgi:hypothetical protein